MPAAFWRGWRLRECRGMAEGFGRVNEGKEGKRVWPERAGGYKRLCGHFL